MISLLFGSFYLFFYHPPASSRFSPEASLNISETSPPPLTPNCLLLKNRVLN